MSECEEETIPPSNFLFYVFVCGFVPGLLLISGLLAGLTHGFLSLDATHLAVLRKTGTDAEKSHVKTVTPLLNKHNWILVSMVLMHAIADEALPIVLETLVNRYLAVGLSVPLVILVGEVIPSGIFAGPRQLQLTARFSWVAWVTSVVTGVVSYPIALAMDWWMGSGHKAGPRNYHRNELKAFLQLHAAEEGEITRPGTPVQDKPDSLHIPLLSPRSSSSGSSSTSSDGDQTPAENGSAQRWGLGDFHSELVPFLSTPHAQATPVELKPVPENHGGKPRSDSMETTFPDALDTHDDVTAGTENSGKEPPRPSPHSSHHTHHGHKTKLTGNELGILEGTLNLSSVHVQDRMVPLEKMFILDADEVITPRLLVKVADTAHNRVPVCKGGDRNHVLGVLLVKSLLRVLPVLREVSQSGQTPPDTVGHASITALPKAESAITIGGMPLIQPIVLEPQATMLDALKTFQQLHSRMAFVSTEPAKLKTFLDAQESAPPGMILGLITLEDCLSSVLNSEHQLSDAHEMHLVREASKAVMTHAKRGSYHAVLPRGSISAAPST